MNPDTIEPIDSVASILADEIEIQFVGGKLFLAEESYPQDTDFERPAIKMSARAAYELLCWLYERETPLRQRARVEQEQEDIRRYHAEIDARNHINQESRAKPWLPPVDGAD